MKFLVVFLLCIASAQARTIHVSFLNGSITPETSNRLKGLACHNYDKIVHLKIAIDWQASTVEQDGDKRLILSTDDTEFLFPDGSYVDQHDVYIVDGYFIVRSGGMHQGIVSDAFERIKDELVILNPYVTEAVSKATGC